jgi:hypothetical protein
MDANVSPAARRWSHESCATNSATKNESPANRCCRTSYARIATRYNELATNYLAFVKLAAVTRL